MYLPFDNIKVRFHTMTRLPNGELPYKGISNAIGQIIKYECDMTKLSSLGAFYNGMVPAYAKLYLTLLSGVFLTDYVFQLNYKEGELWEGANAFSGPERSDIPHEPINNFQMNLQTLTTHPTRTVYLKENSSTSIKI